MFLQLTREAFAGLCEIAMIDLSGKPDQAAIADILRAAVIYIPGGNTYLLLKRLQTSGLFEIIHKAVKEGRPFVGFSAGAVICGKSILISKDANECGCRDFAGFGLVPFALDVHYNPSLKADHDEHISRISRFHEKYPIPVLAMEDDAHVLAAESELYLIQGACRLIKPGGSPARIPIGRIQY